MGTYIKTMLVVTVFIVAIAITGFKACVTTSVEVLQKSLDLGAQNSASLIAMSLSDEEASDELIEAMIDGAYRLGTFQEVTLYGKPEGESQNLRRQNKKDMPANALTGNFFELKSNQALADITMDGEVQGKVLVKSDAQEAFKAMSTTVEKLMQLFIILGLGAIVIIGIIVKFVIKKPKA